MIYISFKNALTKEGPEHRQSDLLGCGGMFHWGI